MKKTLLITGLVLFITSFSWAQSSVWKVTGNGTTLYLGGTIHILRTSDYPLPLEYEKAYLKSDVLVFEADIKKLEEDQSMQMQLALKARYTDGNTLKNVLNEEAYEALKKEFESANLDIESMNSFKPSMAVIFLTVKKLSHLGISSTGVDKFYYKKGETDGKQIDFLESIESQIDKLVNIGEGKENEFVLYSIEEMENIRAEFEEMINNWRTGEKALFAEQNKEMKEKYPEMYASLLLERNNAWMEKIEDFFNTPETEFIMVGTMHLYGEDGLLKQLIKKGYLIEQLNHNHTFIKSN